MPDGIKSANKTKSEDERHFSDSQFTSYIDPYLKVADYNNDGFISYEEYVINFYKSNEE